MARREADLVEGLRRRDEGAFAELVETYHQPLVRLAMSFVSTTAAAEDVVQETWLGVLNGIDRFEGRSSLKTWIFRILTNRAKTRGVRDARVVPFSALAAEEADEGPSVEPERFFEPGHRIAGHWSVPPRPWAEGGEERAISRETREVIREAIDALPPAQRTVISLRDVEGVGAEEVCELLELTEGNQRVLLHRARTKVRRALEDYFATGEAA